MKNSIIFFVFTTLLFSCTEKESTVSTKVTATIMDAFYPEILAEVAVLDYNETTGLFLAGEYFSGNFYLINASGEVKHAIQAPERGSPEDYGTPSSASFYDDKSILILSQNQGISRIGLDGTMKDRYELPYRPTLFGGKLSKKARRIDDQSLIIQLEGRADFFTQVREKYPHPLLEYWEPELGNFAPIVTLPEESKYRQFNLFNTPAFTYAEGYLYLANENEPVLYVYRYSENSFAFEKAIPLPLPQFFEPKQNLLDEDDNFYEGEIYLLEVKDGMVYIFYNTGITPEVYDTYEEEDIWEMLALEMKNHVAIVNPKTAEIHVAKLPDEVYVVEALGPDGLFVATQNVYVNASEDDTNKRLLLNIGLNQQYQ